MTNSWRNLARQKRESILAAIPPEWIIADLPSLEEKRDVTGDYIRGFLTEREAEITETDAEKIVNKTTTGQWLAEEVTRAFCHRAALAHQLVPVPQSEIESPQRRLLHIASLPSRDFL
jgi:amidase